MKVTTEGIQAETTAEAVHIWRLLGVPEERITELLTQIKREEWIRGFLMQLKGCEFTQAEGERIIQEVRIRMRKPTENT